MWYQLAQPFYNWPSPSKFEADADPTLHAHSPRRGVESMAKIGERVSTGDQSNSSFYTYMPLPPPPRAENGSTGAKWHSTGLMPDPFVVNAPCFTHNRYTTQTVEEDQLMPDYSRPMTPMSNRNSASMTDYSRPPSILPSNGQTTEGTKSIVGNQNDENSRWAALASIRVNSTASMSQIPTKPSAAAEARAASYANGRHRVVSMTTNEPPPTRDPSDTSINSRFSENQSTVSLKNNVPSRPSPRPAGEVKGRKEGSGNEVEVPRQARKKPSTALNGKEDKDGNKSSKVTGGLGAAKRKRGSIPASQMTAAQGIDLTGSSPIRKASKRADASDAAPSEGSNDSDLTRLSLELLENVP